MILKSFSLLSGYSVYLSVFVYYRVQDDDEEDMSGQAMVGQAVPGTLASGDGNDSTGSQEVFGVANVHVNTIRL